MALRHWVHFQGVHLLLDLLSWGREELKAVHTQQVYHQDDQGQYIHLRTNQVKQISGPITYMDLSSSVSQLNSSMEIFSQLPVFRVGSTWTSSYFGFCIFSMGFSSLFSDSMVGSFPGESFKLSQHIIAVSCSSLSAAGHLFQAYFYSPFLRLFWFSCSLTFLICAFFPVCSYLFLV